MRLYGGASIGPSAITESSVSVAYLFRMAGFPIMYAGLAEMTSQLLEVSVIIFWTSLWVRSDIRN